MTTDPSFEDQPLYELPPPKSWIARQWERLGGGGLSLSLLVHGALLLFAVLYVISISGPEKKEEPDFLAGGGGGQSGASEKAGQKRKQAMLSAQPRMRIASASVTAGAVSLPDVSDTLNLSSVRSMSAASSSMGGSGTGSGGGIGSGVGKGIGSGMGPGSGGGFVGLPSSIFGSAGKGGLTGTLYDMKQDRNRKPLDYNGGVPEFFPKLYEIAKERFRPTAFNEFYRAKVTLSFTMLAVPNVPAEEGPKAFQADREIQPRGWFVHYQGKIDPPTEAEWRFAGVFDDALLIYINNRLVFDGSYDSEGAEEETRQPFGDTPVAGGRSAFVGKWVRLKQGADIDIIVGERPGGRVGGVLLVQKKHERYETRPDGQPILPVFAFNPPRKEDLERIEKVGYPIAKETPVFKVFTESAGMPTSLKRE